MFTSRAEYRLQLREDNADLRLTEIGHTFGLIDDVRWRRFSEKQEMLARERERMHDTWIRPDPKTARQAKRALGQPLLKETRLVDLLRRPGVAYSAIIALSGAGPRCYDPEVVQQLEIEARYSGYIERQQQEIERQRHNEDLRIPDDQDFGKVRGLSTEALQNLQQQRPRTLGQASRISGVTPAAISLLLVHLKKHALQSAM